MKSKIKRYRIIAVLAAAVCCACVFATCAGEQTRHLYIRNTNDEEINITIEFRGSRYVTSNVREPVHSQTIPADTTVEFALFDICNEAGQYRITSEAASKPGKKVYKAFYRDEDEHERFDILVVF